MCSSQNPLTRYQLCTTKKRRRWASKVRRPRPPSYVTYIIPINDAAPIVMLYRAFHSWSTTCSSKCFPGGGVKRRLQCCVDGLLPFIVVRYVFQSVTRWHCVLKKNTQLCFCLFLISSTKKKLYLYDPYGHWKTYHGYMNVLCRVNYHQRSTIASKHSSYVLHHHSFLCDWRNFVL